MTKETGEIESVYLYVHTFKWFKKEDEAHFKGHLKGGRVYKAQVDQLGDKTLYKIELFDDGVKPSGVAILELKGKFDSWECDIEVIEDENLLDLIITDEDMEMMASYGSQFSGLTGIPTEEEIAEELAEMIQKDGRPMDVKLVTDHLLRLYELDEEMVKFLMMLVQGITDILLDEDYITMTGHLSTRTDKVGRIANVTLAAAHLEAHLNSGDNNPANLMNSIFTILLELKRTVKIT